MQMRDCAGSGVLASRYVPLVDTVHRLRYSHAHAQVRQGGAADAKELVALRKERDEWQEALRENRAAKAKKEQELTEQSGQLKQITSLQLQLAELQRELQHRDEHSRTPPQPHPQPFGFGSSGGGGGGGGFFGLFGGSSGELVASPGAHSPTRHGWGHNAELGAELEAKKAETAALHVQLANLQAALTTQEQMIAQMRASR